MIDIFTSIIYLTNIDMKTNSVFSLLLILISTITLSSCGTSQQAAKADFYGLYSQKLGVTLTGKEDRELIKSMADWKGTPYKYASNTKKGTDCSGFVSSIYNEVYGKKLERSSYEMINDVEIINKKNLQAGDLLFFKLKGKKISHVGIYIANNKFIHAETRTGVVITDLDKDYYKKGFYKAGRVKM